MVEAKIYGVVRLNTGLSSVSIEACRVDEAIRKLAAESKVEIKDLKRCTILVNGKQARMRTKLSDGDEVVFLSPAGGG